MYETLPPDGYDAETAVQAYTKFLSDLPRFSAAIRRVLAEWPISCKQFLTNLNINRIAWIGQSSMSIATGVPARFRAGFSALSEEGQRLANELAEAYLWAWEADYLASPIYYRPEVELATPSGMKNRIVHYLRTWEQRGYEKGIPDEVPSELMRLNLAPSHKAIALAILRNDHSLSTLGYSQPVSPWCGVLKRVELAARANHMNDQMF